ncbi:MAG TPA: carboxypeptidase-like regulatory domain-containing protein, partial [Puia sp.]|nr:carboxypeptidase-like regulatory domain-containing protein [Puia sp.]
MRKNQLQMALSILSILFSLTVFSQTPLTLTGTVRQSVTKDRVPAVSVTVKGTSIGTFTDDRGNFKLAITQQPPYILVFSSIGYETQEVSVSSAGTPVTVDFVPSSTLG